MTAKDMMYIPVAQGRHAKALQGVPELGASHALSWEWLRSGRRQDLGLPTMAVAAARSPEEQVPAACSWERRIVTEGGPPWVHVAASAETGVHTRVESRGVARRPRL